MSQVGTYGPGRVEHGAVIDTPANRLRIDPRSVTMDAAGARVISLGLIVLGLIAVAVIVVAGFAGMAPRALASYHAGVIFCVTLTLGCLFITMILHLTNAGWSSTVRRLFEVGGSLTPWLIVMLAPAVIVDVFAHGMLFQWMNPQVTAGDVIAQHKQAYLNLPMFTVRALVYFAAWTYLGHVMYSTSIAQDRNADPQLTRKARYRSGWGLLVLSLSSTFASFDWVMSLDYHWFSTMFGVCFFAGCFLSAVCVAIIVYALLKRGGKLGETVTEEHFHDMGKLMLTFVVFWAYVSFAQYFLIWYSNIPEESGWYWLRNTQGWQYIGFALCAGHFVLPFLILLFRPVKRMSMLLAVIAVWLLVMHAVDLNYMIQPPVGADMGAAGWALAACGTIGPVAIWLGLMVRKLAQHPVIPMGDPRLAEAVEHKNYI